MTTTDEAQTPCACSRTSRCRSSAQRFGTAQVTTAKCRRSRVWHPLCQRCRQGAPTSCSASDQASAERHPTLGPAMLVHTHQTSFRCHFSTRAQGLSG